MASPFTIRWGILAFTKDLLIDPSTRSVSDIHHEIVAAASSSSKSRAEQFLKDCKCPSSAKAYGSYEELVKDPNIDIIYVATPHSHHYQNAMLCLLAGKHVLCEKAFTVNAKQAKKLVETAKEKGMFLMEAVWTRYFPMSVEIRKIIESGKLGAVHRTIADNSVGEEVEKVFGTEHRMVNMDLAGGALLDLGIYSLTWVFQTLYHTLPASQRKAPSVLAKIEKYAKTGADEHTSMILSFPSGPHGSHASHGIALTSLRVASDPDKKNSARPAIRIQGTKGEIQVDGPAYRPTTWRIIWKEGSVEEKKSEIPGHGMFWEADEAARCVRDKKQESEGLTWEESIVIMEAMDEVRRQNDLIYPEKIETVEYPVKPD
ncbi:MAG: hypothetical protein MMC33_002623 [Icmadophila ericetorum]|nr:hypothetical protein [Icmadophila ericetorum]